MLCYIAKPFSETALVVARHLEFWTNGLVSFIGLNRGDVFRKALYLISKSSTL